EDLHLGQVAARRGAHAGLAQARLRRHPRHEHEGGRGEHRGRGRAHPPPAPRPPAPRVRGRAPATAGRAPSAALTTSITGRAAHTMASAARTDTFVANSLVRGAISSTDRRPMEAPNARRAGCDPGVVFGSVIMKNRNTRISGDSTRTRQSSNPVIGPRCQRAVIAWSVVASTAMPA